MTGPILLSAGGTGGHVMPAQALALDLKSRGYDVEWVTDKRGMKYAGNFQDIPIHEIRAGTLGAGVIGKVRGVADLGIGILQAGKIISKIKPAAVVGFGGYPSFPAVYAAQRNGIPTILHEQNAIIGKANAMLAHKAERIASSTPELRGVDEIDCVRTVFTGNPVRAEISALYTQPYPVLSDDGQLNILVMGGSLGAHIFSEVLPEALSRLPQDQRARLRITQQCREEDMTPTKEAYAKAGIEADLHMFIRDVAEHLKTSHLVIARSGASTVAEVSTAGRPAIYVPYPHHKDQQQKMNADVVSDRGGAWLMTQDGFTPDAVLARIETFLQNSEILFRAAEKARACSRPDAARKLGNLVTAVISGWTGDDEI
ncbi:MAG: undecaprenyldiphospho-muramoylpentapeptide beta-N-acetylglucosaminyltransferase [Alphaproteobacteria bacterium]|nr:undecaprenyldiphospho-muramoylpentapeptide beta-N-acetylglucosaminyltransferase [Alphaproteobacteria bacterium]